MLPFYAKARKASPMPKLSDQVSIRIDPEWRETLRVIEEQHRIPPPEFIRGLVAAGLEFYRTNGWFAFPIEVLPERNYVHAVAETQAVYDPNPPAVKKARKRATTEGQEASKVEQSGETNDANAENA
jgi:hypothetical protein